MLLNCHAGGEKESLDIIAAIEPDGEFCQFPGGECRSGHVVGAAVDAVLAVIYAVIGHEDLQQRDAASIGREAVAAARKGGTGIADHPGAGAAANAAGGTRRIVFGSICQNTQFIQQLHLTSAGDCATGAVLGMIQPVYQAHHQRGKGGSADQNKSKIQGSHKVDSPLSNIYSSCILTRTNVPVKWKSKKCSTFV